MLNITEPKLNITEESKDSSPIRRQIIQNNREFISPIKIQDDVSFPNEQQELITPTSLKVPLNNLTLFYLNIRGRGEPIRLLLNYLNISFIDYRISKERWLGIDGLEEAFKNRTPFGHLPLIKLIDGREIAESFAIMRLIARQNNLVGDDQWEDAKIDEFADFHKDSFSAFHDFLFLTETQIQQENPTNFEKFQNLINQYLPIYQRQLQLFPSSNFLFKKLSWPDFLVVDFVESLTIVRPFALIKYPELVELRRKIYELPQLQNYLSKRIF
ncbi:GST N-terminal domain-containing protein, partial [Meloidogyne graminicola]